MFGLFKSSKNSETAHRLYSAIIQQARLPIFYTDFGVPDTVDGRFDMIVLHAHILFDRLKDGIALDESLSQDVFDLMFADMDQNLREMGVGDIGVAKRIKAMVEAYYGRATAYADALKQEDNSDLMAAIKKNLFRKSDPTDSQITAVSDYFRAQVKHMASIELDTIRSGNISFIAPQGIEIPA